jgi:hypothetical protein
MCLFTMHALYSFFVCFFVVARSLGPRRVVHRLCHDDRDQVGGPAAATPSTAAATAPQRMAQEHEDGCRYRS